jgi:hypothetical protein
MNSRVYPTYKTKYRVANRLDAFGAETTPNVAVTTLT